MARKKKDDGQAGMFDAPAPPKPAPPARPPVDQSVIVFAQRHLGRSFTMPDLSSAIRAEIPRCDFAAASTAFLALRDAGTIECEKLAPNRYRVIAVKP